MTSELLTHQIARRLRNAGLRVTSARVAILGVIEHDVTHPSAEQLFERLQPEHPSLSLSTVYNTLESFLRVGLCRRVVGDGNRLRVDGTVDSHDHAVCRRCGTIFDVARDLCPLPPPPSSLPHGLALIGVRIEYDVLCQDCRTHGSEIGARIPDTPAQRAIENKHECKEV